MLSVSVPLAITLRWFAAVAAFKVNQYGLSTKRLLMIFRWNSDTAAIAQLPPVGSRLFSTPAFPYLFACSTNVLFKSF